MPKQTTPSSVVEIKNHKMKSNTHVSSDDNDIDDL